MKGVGASKEDVEDDASRPHVHLWAVCGGVGRRCEHLLRRAVKRRAEARVTSVQWGRAVATARAAATSAAATSAAAASAAAASAASE